MSMEVVLNRIDRVYRPGVSATAAAAAASASSISQGLLDDRPTRMLSGLLRCDVRSALLLDFESFYRRR